MSASIIDSNAEVTEQLAREIRQWAPRDAADFYFKKSREIESRMQKTFLEFGIVLNEIEKRELYREMPRLSCPVCKLKVEWNLGRCPYCVSMSFRLTIAFARLNSSRARLTRFSNTSSVTLSADSSSLSIFAWFSLTSSLALMICCREFLSISFRFSVLSSLSWLLLFWIACCSACVSSSNCSISDCADWFWAICCSRLNRSSKAVLLLFLVFPAGSVGCLVGWLLLVFALRFCPEHLDFCLGSIVSF